LTSAAPGSRRPDRGERELIYGHAARQAAEARVAEGRATDMRRGRQRFGEYVTETWLPSHVMELSTRQSYTYVIKRYRA
jgi:hypothetical protein